VITEEKHNAHDVHNAAERPQFLWMRGNVLKAAKDAILIQNTKNPLVMLIFILDPAPENHFPIVETHVTYICDAPTPKTTFPSNMKVNEGETVTITIPTLVRIEAKRRSFFDPKMSLSTPPNSTRPKMNTDSAE
jgi:hypothetical protein